MRWWRRGDRSRPDEESAALRVKYLGFAEAFVAAEEERGRPLGYDWDGAYRLDEIAHWYVAEGWRSIPPDEMAIQLGAFLGECILRELGGQWHEADLVWDTALTVGTGLTCYPFAKARARLAPDSVDPLTQYLDHLRTGGS